jgi:hypothetical protein
LEDHKVKIVLKEDRKVEPKVSSLKIISKNEQKD